MNLKSSPKHNILFNVFGCFLRYLKVKNTANLPDWIRAPNVVMMALCFSIDPGVLSKYNMDAQGCMYTLVLGDYLLKVIWDHSMPLIIPESIQHLHLFCCIHRSISKTKAASAG